MIAVDSNILVYAFDRGSPWHERSAAALAGIANGRDGWAIPWPCLNEFYSVVTNPRLWASPPPPSEALRAIHAWASSPSISLLSEGAGFLEEWSELVESSQVAGARCTTPESQPCASITGSPNSGPPTATSAASPDSKPGIL